LLKQLAQLVEAILPVSFLISVSLGREHQFPQRGQAVMLLNEETRLDILRQALASCWVPAKDCLRGNLIHILTARTAGADEAPGKLGRRNANKIVDLKHCFSLLSLGHGDTLTIAGCEPFQLLKPPVSRISFIPTELYQPEKTQP
jgi:hypothetical protein